MSKIIKLPGRVESAEVGGIVTGANAIMDDGKGKVQSVINNEVDEELLRLQNEKQDNITVDNAPTEGSDNPVSSGGVFNAEKALSDAIEAILLLIPSAASALNQLADKEFVASSIATSTATFKGTFNLVSDLHLSADATHEQIAGALDSLSLDADTNDYCFVQVPESDTSEDIKVTQRYKFNGTEWAYEYDLNNSGFTAEQWAAINSNITAALTAKLMGLPTSEVLAGLLGGKQDVLTFDEEPTAGSNNPVTSGGVFQANNDIIALINALEQAKQDVLTFDLSPVQGSSNPVTSGGVYDAIYLVQTVLATVGGNVETLQYSVGLLTEQVGILNALYQAITQSDIIVGALPGTGVANRVYRVPGTSTYSDWMWYDGAWVKLAEYTTLDGYVYKGVAVPMGGPSGSAVKMFYIAIEPGTYLNFGNLEVERGINILKYDGANWSKDTIIGIDAVPANNSQNLVTSGAVFDYVTKNGGAYDISANNPVEGQPAVYETLSDALGANGANVPADVRKGGMSVKFIQGTAQSSDNKYVQYRYMSSSTAVADFIKVANWQGVDDKPTAGSNNLVKSGGVAGAIKIYVLVYTTDIATTRLSLPESKRGFGVTLVYNIPGIGLRVETFKSEDPVHLRDAYFARDTMWETYIFKNKDIFEAPAENIALTNTGYVYHSPSSPSTSVEILANDDYIYSNPIAVVKGDLIKVITRNLSQNVSVIAACDANGSPTKSLVQSTNSIWQTGIDDEYCYLAQESGYVIVSTRNAYEETRIVQKGHANISYIVADILSSISDYDSVKATVNEIRNVLEFEVAYLETLNKVDANASTYLNPNYELVMADSKGYRYLTNPIFLHKGDSVIVHSSAMSTSNAVVALSSTDNLQTASFQTLLAGNGESGYQDYSFVIPNDGYYVIGWAAFYSAAYAKIQHIVYSKIDQYDNHFSDIDEQLAKIGDEVGVAANVFGDVLPTNFRNKFFDSEEDVEIVCVGDSLTGLIEYSGAVNDPAHTPPGMTYNHWTYLLWDRICLNKAVCDRLDSQRNDTDVFSKTGTWSLAEFGSSESTGDYGEYSISANTYKSSDLSASVAFTFDADSYKKLNLVFSKEPDGAEMQVIVAEGNGKLLASLDKTTWVEANNFSFSELTSNIRERHRRLWMKIASGVSGELNVTVQRTDSDTDKAMYFWGTEKWNGASLFLINIGRGGRDISKLNVNINDIFDRIPDLCILELPLANETVVGAKTLSVLKDEYLSYINDFKTASSDFANTEMLVVLPHGRSGYYNGNVAIKMQSSGTVDMINHLKCNAIYNYVKTLVANYSDNANCVNLMEQLYNEGLNKSMTIQGWLSSSTITVPTLTKDGIHLNNLGSRYWSKYLSAIFQ